MIVPDSAIPYILFQRAYFRLPVTPIYRALNRVVPFPTPLYNLAVAVESRFGRDRIRAAYAADMADEYAAIRPYLPPDCGAVLDVGCGVAGIDAFLAHHYAPAHPDVYLLDRTRVDPSVYYLFHERGAFYNALGAATELLVANGLDPARLHPLEAGDDGEIPIPGPVDLVVSLLAWGFHFPVAVYLARVRQILSEHGVVILDARRGTAGLDALRSAFADVQVVRETEKYARVVARAPG